MIDLTPLEVRQKKGDFRRAFRGYDAELVNDFLDLVADRMEELVKQNMAMSEGVQSLRQELEEYRSKERALSDALMTAQKLQEESRKHAEKEGELLIREARLAAESARQEATKALAREEDTLREVRARRSQLIESFRRLLEREIGELAVIEQALDLEASKQQEAAARTDQPVEPETDAESSGGAPREEPSSETTEQDPWAEGPGAEAEPGASGQAAGAPQEASGTAGAGPQAPPAQDTEAPRPEATRKPETAPEPEATPQSETAGRSEAGSEREAAAGEREEKTPSAGRHPRKVPPAQRRSGSAEAVEGTMDGMEVEWPDPGVRPEPGAGGASGASAEEKAAPPSGSKPEKTPGRSAASGSRSDDDEDVQEDWLKSLVEE